MSTREQRQRRSRIAVFITLTVVTLVHLVPVMMMIVNGLRTDADIMRALFAIPSEWHFENIPAVWVKGGYADAYLSNFIIGPLCVVLVVSLIALAAYGIVKLKIFLPNFFTAYFIGSLSIPMFGIIVPLYFIFHRVGLVDTRAGIILIYSALYIPFNFLLMRAFFIGIPEELENAARLDGCNELQTIWYVTVPLALPIIVTIALIVFTFTWNEFLFANTFLQNDQIRTVSLKFFKFTGEYVSEYAYIYAAGVISTVPIILLYLLLQRTFIEGMTRGSVKA